MPGWPAHPLTQDRPLPDRRQSCGPSDACRRAPGALARGVASRQRGLGAL